MITATPGSASPRQLTRLTVEGLLGRFEHTVAFPPEWPFVILHGPNGVGKTHLLELVAATFARPTNVGRIREIPFESATFSFSDQAELRIGRQVREANSERAFEVQFGLTIPGQSILLWSPPQEADEIDPVLLRRLERDLPVERVDRDRWLDLAAGDYLSLAQLQERYWGRYRSRRLPGPGAPDPIAEFLATCPVHLIATQRLLSPAAAIPSGRPGAARTPRNTPTVSRLAEDLSSRLQAALATNSRISQRLDQTFPRRLIEGSPSQITGSDESIRAQFEEQRGLRERLSRIALLEVSGELPLPERALEDWERRVLAMSLDDAAQKLANFQPLLEKVELFETIVNERFLFKELRIDAEKGFRIATDEGTDLDPSSLSSGEQHELVLAYDLLFGAQDGSLVLIDEPEISLHVTWQQEFLADIARIAELTSLRFIVATHSPQIVHHWWSRTVALGEGHLSGD